MINPKYFLKGVLCSRKFDSPAIALGASFIAIGALLKNLVLSSTTMKPGKSTSGHIHKGQEEVYFFISGKGTMYLDDVPMQVGPGDVVLIEDGVHHRVESDMYQGKDESLYFVCVFDGKRSH